MSLCTSCVLLMFIDSNTPAMQRAHQIAAQRRAQSVPPIAGSSSTTNGTTLEQLRKQLPSMVGPDRRRHPTQMRAMSSPVERRPQTNAGLLAPMQPGHVRSSSTTLPSIRSITASPPQAPMASLPPHARDAAHPYPQTQRRDPRQSSHPQQIDRRPGHQQMDPRVAQQQLLRQQQIAQARHVHEQKVKAETAKLEAATAHATEPQAAQSVQKSNLIYSKAHVKMVLRNVCPVESVSSALLVIVAPLIAFDSVTVLCGNWTCPETRANWRNAK